MDPEEGAPLLPPNQVCHSCSLTRHHQVSPSPFNSLDGPSPPFQPVQVDNGGAAAVRLNLIRDVRSVRRARISLATSALFELPQVGCSPKNSQVQLESITLWISTSLRLE